MVGDTASGISHPSRSTFTTATVLAELGRHTAWLSGPAGTIHAAVRAARAPKGYDQARRAVTVPIRHVDDVVAALELRLGVTVERRQVST